MLFGQIREDEIRKVYGEDLIDLVEDQQAKATLREDYLFDVMGIEEYVKEIKFKCGGKRRVLQAYYYPTSHLCKSGNLENRIENYKSGYEIM